MARRIFLSRLAQLAASHCNGRGCGPELSIAQKPSNPDESAWSSDTPSKRLFPSRMGSL